MTHGQTSDRVFMVLVIVLAVTFGGARAPAEPLSGVWSWQRNADDTWPFSLPAREIRFMFGPDGAFLAMELQTWDDIVYDPTSLFEIGLTDWNPVLPAGQQSVWYAATVSDGGVDMTTTYRVMPSGDGLSYNPQSGQVSWTAWIQQQQQSETSYGGSTQTIDYTFVLSGQFVPGDPDRIDWQEASATRSVNAQEPETIPGGAALSWSKSADIDSIEDDEDGDGVPDFRDYCPDTPDIILDPLDTTPDRVSASGCSASQRDPDGDGVMDDADDCPGTPRGRAVNEAGCELPPPDTDGDGVPDDRDVCPDTPQGTQVAANGCPAEPLGGTWILQAGFDSTPIGYVEFDPQGRLVRIFRPCTGELEVCNPELPVDVDTLWLSDLQEGQRYDWWIKPVAEPPLLLDPVHRFVSWVDKSDIRLYVDDQLAMVGSPVAGKGTLSEDGRSIEWVLELVNGTGMSMVFISNRWQLDTCPDDPAKTQPGACGCGVPEGSCGSPPGNPAPTDADNDGVPDGQDVCPGTPAGTQVDANGCPLAQDADGDGVADGEDQCASTPAGEAVNADGCSQSQLDDDGDGVANSLDTCPNTASGTTVDADGCPAVIVMPPDSGQPTPGPDDGQAIPDGGGHDNGQTTRPPPFSFCGWGIVEGMLASLLGLTLMRAERRRWA